MNTPLVSTTLKRRKLSCGEVPLNTVSIVSLKTSIPVNPLLDCFCFITFTSSPCMHGVWSHNIHILPLHAWGVSKGCGHTIHPCMHGWGMSKGCGHILPCMHGACQRAGFHTGGWVGNRDPPQKKGRNAPNPTLSLIHK